MSNVIYMVSGLVDFSNGEDSAMDLSPWAGFYKTRAEAEEAKVLVTEHYKDLNVSHSMEVREVNLDELDTLDKLKAELKEEKDMLSNS